MQKSKKGMKKEKDARCRGTPGRNEVPNGYYPDLLDLSETNCYTS